MVSPTKTTQEQNISPEKIKSPQNQQIKKNSPTNIQKTEDNLEKIENKFKEIITENSSPSSSSIKQDSIEGIVSLENSNSSSAIQQAIVCDGIISESDSVCEIDLNESGECEIIISQTENVENKDNQVEQGIVRNETSYDGDKEENINRK